MAGESFVRGIQAQKALTPTDQFAQLGSVLGGSIGQGIGQSIMDEMNRGKREAFALQKAYEAGYVDEAVARKNFPMLAPENLPVEILPGMASRKMVNIHKLKEMAMAASALTTAEEQRNKIQQALEESKSKRKAGQAQFAGFQDGVPMVQQPAPDGSQGPLQAPQPMNVDQMERTRGFHFPDLSKPSSSQKEMDRQQKQAQSLAKQQRDRLLKERNAQLKVIAEGSTDKTQMEGRINPELKRILTQYPTLREGVDEKVLSALGFKAGSMSKEDFF